MNIRILISATVLFIGSCKHGIAQTISVNEPLPEWREGYMDLHHINTGRGSCMFGVLPDGTTLLVDAGELSPLDSRTFTPRNAVIRPDSSKKPFEWIADYIGGLFPKSQPTIDYALITHFHDDHFGAWYPQAPLSASGKYRMTGITGVADKIKVKHLVDRGFPTYDYPYSVKKAAAAHAGGEIRFDSTMLNYFAFCAEHTKKGMKMIDLSAGSKTQLKLLKQPEKYSQFFIRNVKRNQWIWTGKDSAVYDHFGKDILPDENSMSIALTLNYGPFVYYTGGDNPGNIFPGDDSSRDVETPISSAVGEVDVAVMDHHGNRDAVNAAMIRNFNAAVWIGQSWSADHPGHEVLIRLTNKFTNTKGSDLFATNMLDANRYVIGPLIDKSYKSTQGHIVVRVLPGGKKYYVIILEDHNTSRKVKAVHGPYTSSTKPATSQ